jgi:hypothetical protein
MKRSLNIYLYKQNLAKYIFVIFLMSLYFILEANNQYWLSIPVVKSLKIGSFVFFISFLFFYALQFFMGKEKALLIVCWLAMNYLFFKVIYKNIATVDLFSTLKQYKYYLPFLFMVIGLLTVIIMKIKKVYLLKLFSYTATLFSILVLVEIGKVILNIVADDYKKQRLTDTVKFNTVSNSTVPDVFLIVLDEYSGTNSLKKNYNFDNNQFCNALQQRGFFVAKNPSSNYNGTIFSTLSLLDMSYIDTSLLGDIKSPKAYARVARDLAQNQLFQFFRQNQYKVVNNSFLTINKTPSNPYLILPIEDRLIIEKTFGYALINDFMLNIKSNKVQEIVGTFYAEGDQYNQHAITKLKKMAADTAPRLFVYTHLMMPHSPYLRDEHGRLRNFADAHAELMRKQYDRSYIAYLKYCNNVVEGIVKEIIAKKQKTIIVLVSDHGNRYIENKRIHDDDFANFIAVYSYDRNYFGFNDTISLVNVFRTVLNSHFSQNLKMLPTQHVNVLKGVLN